MNFSYGHVVGSSTTYLRSCASGRDDIMNRTLSNSVAQPNDAANRAITIRKEALFDAIIWASNKWATVLSGSNLYPLGPFTTPTHWVSYYAGDEGVNAWVVCCG